MPKDNNGANLGFEDKLWVAADKLRGHADASEYKHVVFHMTFVKYIYDAFETQHARLGAEHTFHNNCYPDLKTDYMFVNQPFLFGAHP